MQLIRIISGYIFQMFFAISCIGQASVLAETNMTSPSATADRITREVFQKEKFPGMALEVWKDGQSVFSKGYGFANVEIEKPIDPKSSLFRIGSISKPLTAAGLAILYEAGKIDLDTLIQTYVPSFPKKEFDISLRQLAGHLGGIRHYKGAEFMNKKHYATVEEGLAIFAADPLINEPGTSYSYSSYGWNLISAAIEQAAQQDFLSFMTEKVFKEIGMKNTKADYANKAIQNKVTFYDKNFIGFRTESVPVDNSYKWAGGGFLSTVEDLAIFAQAHLDASFLEKETVDLWTASQKNRKGESINYGIGWRSGEDKKGRRWYGHGGGSVGGSSLLLVFPEEKVVAVLCINLGQAQHGNLLFRVAEQFLNLRKR